MIDQLVSRLETNKKDICEIFSSSLICGRKGGKTPPPSNLSLDMSAAPDGGSDHASIVLVSGSKRRVVRTTFPWAHIIPLEVWLAILLLLDNADDVTNFSRVSHMFRSIVYADVVQRELTKAYVLECTTCEHREVRRRNICADMDVCAMCEKPYCDRCRSHLISCECGGRIVCTTCKRLRTITTELGGSVGGIEWCTTCGRSFCSAVYCCGEDEDLGPHFGCHACKKKRLERK